jgi:hypothetical protein
MANVVIGLKKRLSRLPDTHKRNIRIVANAALAMVPHKHNLAILCAKYGGDKLEHGYVPHYQRLFSPIRKRKLTVLEIGVGGYEDPGSGGESLRMWRDFFPNSKVYGIDIFDKHKLNGRRIKTFRGDQSNAAFLTGLVSDIGRPDIVIDDGSHQPRHVIASFEVLFPLLSDHGYYAIEDLYTSYWVRMGGSWKNGLEQNTSISMLKSLVDSLNYRYIPGRQPSELDLSVVSVQFFRKLAIIQKGRNELQEPDFILNDLHLEESQHKE